VLTEAEAHKQAEAGDLELDLVSFLTMMAHKMGNDTAFVLAYSTIMLNTDAHNPRLTGQARMSKATFIESCRRTPDLATLSDMFMGGVYDEIVQQEIEIDVGEEAAAAMGKTKAVKVAAKDGDLNVAPSFDIIGQKMYEVQQKGIAGAPKRVNVGVTQMGLAVFDENSIPVKNVIFQTMKEWAVDKKERGLTIAVLPKGTIYLKTADCKAICDEMTANKEALAAIAAASTAGGMEASFSAAVEEGVPPAGGGEPEAGSPIYRPPTADEEAI